jgi:nucleoside-diphosphate-sugar epimerase
MRVTVTGGAGYVGSALVRELHAAGHEVVVLDRLLHGQHEVADVLRAAGATVLVGDVRDADSRSRALDGADALVHLAAIVGDPACSRDPQLSQRTNVDASRDVFADAAARGVQRVVFASTCSNYGRMSDPDLALDETAPLRPVSLYASQKVEIETGLLGGQAAPAAATCLRFATVYGASRRMRFDLTVNEFTRDLWAGRTLEVFGDQFWRPYVHVDDAARAIELVLSLPVERVAGQVFNVGHSDENYTKRQLAERITERLGGGEVRYVHRDEDPRDYRVSFDRIRDALGYSPGMRVVDGIDEVIAGLEEGRFGDPFSPGHSNLGAA